MDTATHIAMGVGLTALATQDPVMADTMVATATTLVAGSLIPDGDTVLKLKNNATYISHHRGITHSIPFTILWPILITFAIYIVFPHIDATHVWLWTQLAVFLHVFVDIFNSYGTQALRPITNKWIQLSVINTFDPIIFGILCLGIIIWALGVHPFLVFFPIIAIFIIYYIIRFKMQAIIRKQALKQIQQQHHPVKIFVARRLDDDTTEIRLIDLRYYNKGHYSFAAIAHLDKNNHIDHSYIGWVFTEDKLQKKLYVH